LKELRRVVQEYLNDNNSKNENQLFEEFYKLSYNYEVKLEENIGLMREVAELRN
jgi:TnpA family transposase